MSKNNTRNTERTQIDMNDPYKVLGVSYDATDDEIKKAYRELAKKYHPDNYQGSQLADLAEEKMKEVNEAYDTILRQRQNGQRNTSSGSSGYSGSASSAYPNIRRLINEGRFSEAELNLDSINASARNAEWHYLKAVVLVRRGWIYDALGHIDTACAMDPQNEEYKQLKYTLQRNANAYGSGFGSYRSSSDCSGCDVCTSLLCADCLCECCGGDLIRCC